ncbi:hypothetical protein [Streptomyces doebereineriae]|uniref:Secreted protein n=1 Tax=Streptomyces doebereineriae TaxID=3075528 RepID=A0ABU2V4V4_9ACTN|nr:hypothetical protein [Streptomyces sp. DSM 41640]MDT0480587.1 hypothetical protein [Streptomyces sp. DSM 41640]
MNTRQRRTLLGLTAVATGMGMFTTAADAAVPPPEAPQAPVSGYTYVERSSRLSSDPARSVSAPCPSGKVVLAGGVRIVGGGGRVLLRGSYPGHSASGHRWLATAERIGGRTPARWYLRAYAVCADKPAGLTYRTVPSAFNSNSGKSITGTCPAGTRLVGAGARLRGASHRVGINSVTMTQLTQRSASARAAEAVATNLPWSVAVHLACAGPLAGQTFRESGWKAAVGRAQSRTVVVDCPRGTRAFGAGMRLAGASTTLNRLVPVELRPTQSPAGARVTVSELAPGRAATWYVKAQVICAR